MKKPDSVFYCAIRWEPIRIDLTALSMEEVENLHEFTKKYLKYWKLKRSRRG